MGIQISTNFNSFSKTILDARSGPYFSADLTDTSVIAAGLPLSQRSVGLITYIVDMPANIAGEFVEGNVKAYIFDGGVDEIHIVPFGEGGGGGSGWDGTYNLQVTPDIYLFTTNNQEYFKYTYINDPGGPWDGNAEVRIGNNSNMHISILGIIQAPLKLKNSNSLQAYDAAYNVAHNLIYLSSADLIKIGNYVHQTSILSLNPTLDPIVRQGDGTIYTDYTIMHEGNDVYTSALNAVDPGDDLTTPIDVGGIPAGTTISSLEGKRMSDLWDRLLLPLIGPAITRGKSSSISGNVTGSIELGSILSFNLVGALNQGEITSGNDAKTILVGAAIDYTFTGPGVPGSVTQISDTYTITPIPAVLGTNEWSIAVRNSTGITPYYNSYNEQVTDINIDTERIEAYMTPVTSKVEGKYRILMGTFTDENDPIHDGSGYLDPAKFSDDYLGLPADKTTKKINYTSSRRMFVVAFPEPWGAVERFGFVALNTEVDKLDKLILQPADADNYLLQDGVKLTYRVYKFITLAAGNVDDFINIQIKK